MLAKRASVGFEIALRAQKDPGLPATMGLELRAIRDAFKRAGVIFIETDGEGPGVRLQKGEG